MSGAEHWCLGRAPMLRPVIGMLAAPFLLLTPPPLPTPPTRHKYMHTCKEGPANAEGKHANAPKIETRTGRDMMARHRAKITTGETT